MNWLAWRQHRKGLVTLAIILVLYAAVGIPMGLHFWHIYQHALATCGKSNTCSQLGSELLQSNWDLNLNPALPTGGFNFMSLFILGIPFILGMFWGVPLIAREYINKTNLLIWARSVSRRKWLTTKLLWILISTAIFMAIFTALTTWWSKTGNTLALNRFSTLNFAMQGIVPVGYTIFAVALGIMFGAWFKRTLLALAVTFGVFLAVQVVVANAVRPYYMTPLTKTIVTNQFAPGGPSGGNSAALLGPDTWLTSWKIVNNQGQTLSWSNPPKQCIVPPSEVPYPSQAPLSSGSHTVKVALGGNGGSYNAANGGPIVGGTCLESQGYHYVIGYQPSNRYWDFQRIETGLYLALSVIPIGATYWLVLKRDA